jgi:5-methyltetrahydropteroyltriglutamate--homocysteine methyltransferase
VATIRLLAAAHARWRIAGVDCGFGTAVRADPKVTESIVWAKLRALPEGADIASKRLWGS